MTFVLGKRSRTNLEGVHPDLVKVVELAIQKTEVDFTVLEGLRTRKRQQELVTKGASLTMNSRHLTGHAVDLGAWVNGTISWDWDYYHKINEAVEAAATELGVEVDWGGEWEKFPDGPHFQLNWKAYPKVKNAIARFQ